MGKASAPEPPDPKETSAASTGTNISTALANSYLNNANQVTPDGTITYTNDGFTTIKDPYTGQSYQIPNRTATTTLSPAQQAIKDQTDKAQLNLGTLANNQSGFLNDYMAKPFDGSNDATESRLVQLGRERLDPIMAQQRDALSTRLSNQGIKPGSAAYDRAMTQQGQTDNDAINQLILTGHGQAFAEGQAIRNQPINEITALLSGSQVSQPQAAGYTPSTIPTTDNAGLINANYQQKVANVNAQNAQTGSLIGGLFGLGSAFAGNPAFLASDRRVKTDISKVGETDDGQNIYSYRYKAGGPMQLGLMAQEVERNTPDAVREFGGVKHVDYSKALSLGA
ncbi:tail fiber domain-containing protein [Mesorhizobium sp. M7A.F.Ca.US.006.01.1.1]|uniref:tail fiber domain-containing protein n=1 Tax=Mesorhizobium sp. M7A.F.Ca.US.006.01.1.1 TaxID=2496707 RepID=UPI000FCC492D|nr:tail fiber domain-containing protein [Mesorhizobium sp. M7A.F.Ca.US.006.01.1.1]RUZ76919.1 tail fiber domain-containing protein [Mesorhizobium sp. M7A.F.Ca.US.006.01.1.1]